MEKVGVYCRLSEEDRFKKNKNDDSDSIANQKSMLLKYALNQGWDVVDIYSDDDFSGAGTFRPDFERLIKDCESGRINVVLCKTQSRFSRELEVIEKYLHNKFIEWGVRFVSIVDNADTDNVSNKKSRQINGLVNEWYLEDLSDNIRRSLKNKREDGLYMGSFAPYGYLKDPNDKHKLIIDNNVSYIVKEIFNKYKNGVSYYKICEDLNNRGILPPSHYKKSIGSNFVCCNYDYNARGVWTSDSIAKILRNEVYIGNLVQGKKTYVSYKNHKSKQVPKKDWCKVENTHEPIIDQETWDIVQKRLGKHERPSFDGNIHILSQKVYCSTCRKIFMKNVYKVKGVDGKGEKRAYLQCKEKKKYKCCTNKHSIRLDVLEKYVLDSINELLKKCNNSLLKKELENKLEKDKLRDNTIINISKEKVALEKKINETKSYFKNLYQDKINGIISEEEFIMLRKEYSIDIEAYQNQLNEFNEKLEVFFQEKDNTKDIESILKKYKKIKKLNKVIVDEFIDKIYIGELDNSTKTRDIEIVWNFNF